MADDSCPPCRDDAIASAAEAASAGPRRARGFVFTWNNYTDAAEQLIQALAEECTYACYGREIAPTTGTPHLQGYLEFKHPRTPAAVRKLLKGAWVATRRGTPQQAADYANKTLNCWVKPDAKVPVGSGHRTDLAKMKENVVHGVPIGTYAIDLSYQQLRHAEALSNYLEPERRWKPDVWWIYGPTGVGKTTLATDLLDHGGYRTCHLAGKLEWWNKYDAHEGLILDEFRGSCAPMYFMLEVLDKNPCRLPIKGGFRQLLAKTIIVVSPESPHTVYAEYTSAGKKKTDSINQLIRRIDYVVYIDKAGVQHLEKDGTGEWLKWLPYTPHDGWMGYNNEMPAIGYPKPLQPIPEADSMNTP